MNAPQRHEHYNESYLTRERWISYVYQLDAIADLTPSATLEIGAGPGGLRRMMAAAAPDCRHIVADIDPSLAPDLVADVCQLPLADNAVDAVFCCQVLEHIPYDQVPRALQELGRVARRRVVISVPDVSPFFYARLLGMRRLAPALWRGFSLPSLRVETHDFEAHGQHYWELGKRGYTAARIAGDMATAGLTLRQRFRMVERSYWHFFILEPAATAGRPNVRTEQT